MSEELMNIIRDLQTRIEDLENRKPLRGEKGAPGDISSALRNVEQALPAMLEAELRRLQITTLRGEKGEPGRDGRDGQSIKGDPGRNALPATIEVVDSLVHKALIECQLLDETRSYVGPILRFAIQEEIARLQEENR